MVKVEKHGKIYFTRTETYYFKPFRKIINLLRVEFRKSNINNTDYCADRLEGFNRFIKTNDKSKYCFGNNAKYDLKGFCGHHINKRSLYNVLK